MSEKIEVDKKQLAALLAENAQFKKDIKVLHKSTLQTMDILGLIDPQTGTIKEDVLTGKENPFPSILKGGSSLLSLVGQAGIGMSSAKRKLEEKFSFLEELLPLLRTYGK